MNANAALPAGEGTRGASSAVASPHSPWILAHAAFVALTAAAVLLPGGPPWPLTAPANLLHVLALPAPFLFAACLARRRWRAAIAEVLAALLALVASSPHGGVAPARVADADTLETRGELGVTTFNLGVGLARPSDVIEFLRAQDRDIVVLLELTRGVAASLAAELRATHPHQALHAGGIDGKGLLSKHPILAEELFVLEEGRYYLRCTLAVDGRELELVAVHCAPSIAFLGPACAGGRDLERLASSLDPERACLLLGDFNTTSRSASSARLRELGLRDAFLVANDLGFTFPVFGRYFGLPIGRFLRIDQVWHGAELVPLRASAGPDLGSDHLPLSVDFAFAARASAR